MTWFTLNLDYGIVYYTPVSQTRWDPLPTGKTGPKNRPRRKFSLKFDPRCKLTYSHWKIKIFSIPSVLLYGKKLSSPLNFEGKNNRIWIPQSNKPQILWSPLEFVHYFYPHWQKNSHRGTETGVYFKLLKLIICFVLVLI